ncbi:MAG TPA: hypothetical protein VGW38_22605, partial [Chloroflexota bacterium]|nr:hypothetical protein [Chloroflexota bacterium]
VVFLLIVHLRWRSLLDVSAAALVAASLTAFFWLPALGETSLVQLEWATSGNVDFRQWLVDPAGATEKHKHVENRQTRTGYVDLNLHYPHQLIAPPKVSLAQVGLASVGLAFTGVMLVRAARRLALPRRRIRPSPGQAGAALPAERAAPWAVPTFLLIAGVCWYLTIAPSATLWERLPGLHLLQFPWRLLGPIAVCVALAGAGALASLQFWLEARWDRRGWIAGTTVVVLVMSGVLVNSLGDRHYETVDSPDRVIDAHALVEDERKDPFGAGTTSGKEFLPRHVSIPERFYGERRTIRTINTLYPSGEWIGGMFRPLEGPLRLLNWRGGPLWLSARFANDGQRAEPLGIHQLLYAGWEVRVDGTLIRPDTAPHIEVQDASVGFMVVPIPPGEHTITLEFGLTRIRALATATTLAGALGVSVALAWWLARRRPRANPLLVPASSAALCCLIIAGLALRGLLPLVRNVPEAGTARPEHGVWPAAGFSSAYDGLLVNVAEAVRTGQAQLSSPTGSALGLNNFLDVRSLRLTDAEGDRRGRGAAASMGRQWLYMHPTSTVVVDVALPKNRPTAIQSVLAIDPNAWDQPVGDGVRFQASVAPLGPAGMVGESIMVLDKEVNPRANTGERRWVPVEADLSRWSGSTVRLTLRTLPRDELSYDWAGWGDPVVIARDSSRARTG